MSDAIPAFAPGCFGSALAYQAEHAVCKNCVYQAQCEPLHQANLAKLRAHFQIKERYKVKERSPEEVATGVSLPKKVRDLVDRLDNSNLMVTEKLARGENPFAEGFAFLKIAAHILLKRPTDQKTLVAAYMLKTKMTRDTAVAHARMAIQALVHIGAVDLVDGVATIRRG